ncbi:MAG: cupin domain-containing protein [Acidobacteriota bacterium]
MARVFTQADAIRLGLPGRTSLEIVSGRQGAQGLTLRLVEIPPSAAGTLRGPHHHAAFEECTFVLAGTGTTVTGTGEYALTPGDTILIPAGEPHVTRNTGTTPLLLLCFFPVADISPGTNEPSPAREGTAS